MKWFLAPKPTRLLRSKFMMTMMMMRMIIMIWMMGIMMMVMVMNGKLDLYFLF